MVDYVIAADNGNTSGRLVNPTYEANYPPVICCNFAADVRCETTESARHGFAHRESAA